MSSINHEILKKLLKKQFQNVGESHLQTADIYYPIEISVSTENQEYVKELCSVIHQYAMRGSIMQSEVSWVVWYVAASEKMRFYYKDSDFGADIFRIEADATLCSKPLYGEEFVTVFEFYVKDKVVSAHHPGRWQDIVLKQRRNEKHE